MVAMTLNVIWGLLAGFSLAAPAPSASDLARNYTATFEAPSDRFPAFPYSITTLPGPYDALYWQFQNGDTLCRQNCPIQAYSYPATAQFGADKASSVSVSYPGSKVAFFDLQSFATGCAANQSFTLPPNPDGSPHVVYLVAPVNCSITVKGYRGSAAGIPATSTTVQYRPQVSSNSIGAPVARMSLFPVSPTFSGLRTVTFQAAIARDAPKTYGGFYAELDNISYRATNSTL